MFSSHRSPCSGRRSCVPQKACLDSAFTLPQLRRQLPRPPSRCESRQSPIANIARKPTAKGGNGAQLLSRAYSGDRSRRPGDTSGGRPKFKMSHSLSVVFIVEAELV